MGARGWAAGIGLGATLACSGLLPPEPVVEVTPIPDHLQAAEKSRQTGKFAVAEEQVQRALEADPADVAAWRLLGDVNLTRAQQHPKRWKEHLIAARDAYREAVLRDPEDCASWTRLALTLTVASRNEELAPDAATIDALPLAAGREACPSPILSLTDLRPTEPDREANARDRLGSDATEGAVRAEARPDLVTAWAWLSEVDLSWKAGPGPALGAGVVGVVLDGAPIAAGVGGAQPRTLRPPEWLTVGAASGGDVTFTDRFLPARKPATGRVTAPSCPGTTWGFGADGLPLGACRVGDASGAVVYDPTVLVRASSTHYSHDSISRAQVPDERVIPDSIRCLGGGLGLLFTDVPTCEVTYDQPIHQTRRLPADLVVPARSVTHAERLIAAKDAAPWMGEAVAREVATGAYAIGTPLVAVLHAREDVTTCTGRALLQKVVLGDGGISFTCTLDGWDFVFQEMTLTAVVTR